jgi:hypothetical protein
VPKNSKKIEEKIRHLGFLGFWGMFGKKGKSGCLGGRRWVGTVEKGRRWCLGGGGGGGWWWDGVFWMLGR